MNRPNENARRQPGADTAQQSERDSKITASDTLAQEKRFATLRARFAIAGEFDMQVGAR